MGMFVNNPADVAGKEGGADTVRHCTINEFGHPAYGYFKTNNYVQIKYKDFIDCCMKKKLDQASPSAGTHTPEMYTLYQFWGLFLRDVFNASMYEDFKKCALADHNKGNHQVMMEFNAFCISTGLVKGPGPSDAGASGANPVIDAAANVTSSNK